MKILIIKPSSFGDIVQANPVIAALKNAYPDCSISWVVFKQWAGLLSLFSGIDHAYVWDRNGGFSAYQRLIGEIRRQKFDIVIDLQGLFRSAFLAACSGAQRKLGVPGMKEWSWIFVKEVFPASRKMNAARRSLETVRFLTGVEESPVFSMFLPQDAVSEADRVVSTAGIVSKSIIALVPFSRGRGKEWNPRNYRELINLCAAQYPQSSIVLLGDKADAGKIRDKRIRDLCGMLSLQGLGALLARCAVVAGGDTGPTHLSAALNIPTVMLFGGSDVSETAPAAGRVTILKKSFACSPCRGRTPCDGYPCLEAIKPKEVFAAVQSWMQ